MKVIRMTVTRNLLDREYNYSFNEEEDDKCRIQDVSNNIHDSDNVYNR